MHPPHLLLSLILLLPLSAASVPPLHHPRFSKHHFHHQNSTGAPPQEYIEITAPLRFDSLTPSCTLPLLSHTFAYTLDLPPTNATYFPPINCPWSHAVLQFSAAANGAQEDRIAGVWLAGAELLRTSTPQSTDGGLFWSFRKDITRYASLLRQPNLTLSVMLENAIDNVFTGAYTVNITFLYYDVPSNETAVSGPSSLFRLNRKSTIRKLEENLASGNLNKSLELNENPADLILPISAAGDEGFWFKIQGELDAVYQAIQIPLNTYRAVIEVYVSFHGNDEFWYTNPPNYYFEANGLPTDRGHGAYREVLVKLDDNIVGSAVPFPVVYPGGINPTFWEPVVAIGAFHLPTYEIELTPFLGILLDGKVHFFGLGVADAIPYWLVDANLHLWLDDKVDKVQAGPIKYSDPNTCVERESSFQQLDGKFEIEAEKEAEFSGWVYSSAGNFTIQVTSKLDLENTVKFKNNGTRKTVKHEAKATDKVEIKSPSGGSITSTSVERKHPLKLKTRSSPGSGEANYLISTELEQSVEEERKIGRSQSKLQNRQESSGWMFVHGDDFLSGAGTTSQRYSVKDGNSCYSRRVSTEGGDISRDTENFLCAAADY